MDPTMRGPVSAAAVATLLLAAGCAAAAHAAGCAAAAPGPIEGSFDVGGHELYLECRGQGSPTVVYLHHILLGASFGGLLALAYAGTYPEDVVGMVLLDPVLPDDDLWEREYAPPEWWLAEDAWKEMTEQIDVYNANAQTRAVLDDVPSVPVTLVATAELDLPSSFPQAGLDALRADQRALVERFEQGEIVTFDVPHYMEPVIPKQIADVASKIP